jgi:hypothetical protein
MTRNETIERLENIISKYKQQIEELREAENYASECMRQVSDKNKEIKSLKAELQAEREVVDFYADDSNWQAFHVVNNSYGTIHRSDIVKNYFGEDEHCGGKRARQRQAERKIK